MTFSVVALKGIEFRAADMGDVGPAHLESTAVFQAVRPLAWAEVAAVDLGEVMGVGMSLNLLHLPLKRVS